MSKLKIKSKLKKPLSSQWEIIEDDALIAQEGLKIPLNEFRPKFANSNENIQQGIKKQDFKSLPKEVLKNIDSNRKNYLYNTLNPNEEDPFNIINGIRYELGLDRTLPLRDENGNEDAWKKYLQLPNDVEYSDYKDPTKSKTDSFFRVNPYLENAIFNRFKNIDVKDSVVNEGMLPINDWYTPLNNFTIGKDKDKDGEFIYYRDTYDFSPDVTREFRAGQPFNFYNKRYLSEYKSGGSISEQGYKDNSPYRNSKSIDIYTPTGLIDMSETGIPLIANGVYMPPYSGMYQFEPGVVKEERIMQSGGNIKDNLIKIDGEWYNQDIIDGLDRDNIVEQRRWNTNMNRYGAANEEEFYKRFPTENDFILENQRRYANHIGSSRKYIPQDETLMQQGGQVRQPIKGTKEQYQAYQDSLDLYNDSKQRTNSALQNANSIANRYNLNRHFWQSPLNVTNEIYPLNYAAESGMSADGDFNYENYWAETENIQNRPNYSRIRGIANRTGYLPRVRRITTTHENNTSDVHDYVHFYDWQQPVQPIIYEPENEIQNLLEQPQVSFPNTTNGQFNRTISKIRPKETPIQIESKKADLLPTSPMNLEIERIPFAKGTYFSRERQNQELDSKQFGREGKKDYFDKKTGKLLGTYKTGGKVSDWEIIFD